MARINWNPSKELKNKAKVISMMKEEMTYDQIREKYDYHETYLIELKKLGDKLREEQNGQ